MWFFWVYVILSVVFVIVFAYYYDELFIAIRLMNGVKQFVKEVPTIVFVPLTMQIFLAA